MKSPGRRKKILRIYERSRSNERLRKMNNDEALKLTLDSNLTKHQYLLIRQNRADIYPSYQELCSAKNCCYPEDIVVTNNFIYCPLQSLVDHTSSRLVLCLNGKEPCEDLSIIYKLGFDGSSGQSKFKHVSEKASVSDSTVYISTLVPIRIIEKCSKNIVLQNPCPNSKSYRYCRPVRIAYEKENSGTIKEEYE